MKIAQAPLLPSRNAGIFLLMSFKDPWKYNTNFSRRISPQKRKDRKEKESPQRHGEHGEDYKD
ncbi:MAG TPA: hypothetical protein VKF42_11720 [Chitinivibrionales bacterium]|nr:hypothetical protein [Chitinivibrionales bacterium]